MTPDLHVHECDDEGGAFHASFHLSLSGTLLRRPCSAEPWVEADELHWEQTYRWSDVRWDWCCGTTAALSVDQLAALKEQLAASS